MKKLGLDLVNLYLLRNINLAQKFELFYTTTMWIISFSDSVEPILISHLMDIVVHTLKICVCAVFSQNMHVRLFTNMSLCSLVKQGLVFSFQKTLHNNSLPIYQDRIHNCVRALKSLWYLSKCMLLFASYSWLNSNVNWDQKFVETTEVFCQFLTPRCASKVSSHGPITYKLLMHSAL